MKTIFLAISLFFTLNAFSSTEYGFQLEKVTCGENDPYILGDICLLEISYGRKSI